MRGHVFVVQADVTTISCDAWLCPTDGAFSVTRDFRPALGITGQFLSGHTWNGRRAVPYTGQASRGTQIVLGNVGQQEHADGKALAAFVRKLIDVVGDFVDAAAVCLRRGAEQHLRLALPLIGTGAGGFKFFKGDTIKPLLDELNRLAATEQVDFVLCVRTPEAWSAVQSARAPGDWALTEKEEAQAAALAREARDGRLVLFIGAGASRDAGLPDWKSLLEDLDSSEYSAEQRKLVDQLDLRDRATLIERRLGSRRELVLNIQKMFNAIDSSIGLTHALLASLGSQQAITTNYDDLFEQACAWREQRITDKRLAVLPYDIVHQGQPWLLKLHGSLRTDRVDSSHEDDIVLTRADYMRLQRQRGALYGLVQAVLMTKHLLFVGYSLTDEDFHHLVDEIREAMPRKADENRDMRGTVLTFDRSPSIELWDDLLGVTAVGSLKGDGARHLQILLDRVAHAATPSHLHLLKQSFSGLLGQAERDMATALTQVQEKANAILAKSPSNQTALAVRRVLEDFGADPIT